MGDELFEHKIKTELSREQAAARLHEIADALARHNEVSYVENNKTVRIAVPDQVKLKVEFERDEDGDEGEIEIEISW